MTDAPPFPTGSTPETSDIADWCESVALMTRRQFKRGDLKSALSREDIGNPDLLEEQTWAELENRSKLYGAAWPLTMDGSRLRVREDASDDAILLQVYFCILASGDIESEDRSLFEEIVRSIISSKLGKSVVRIGHPARKGDPTSFRERVKDYTRDSLLSTLEVFHEPLPHDKDLGMDVVAWLPSPDNRGGYIHLLIQCATGRNWANKLSDIDLNVINSHIRWAVQPVRIFSLPSVISTTGPQWIRYTQRAGWILDRPRLMHLASGTIITDGLREEISDRIEELAV